MTPPIAILGKRLEVYSTLKHYYLLQTHLTYKDAESVAPGQRIFFGIPTGEIEYYLYQTRFPHPFRHLFFLTNKFFINVTGPTPKYIKKFLPRRDVCVELERRPKKHGRKPISKKQILSVNDPFKRDQVKKNVDASVVYNAISDKGFCASLDRDKWR